MVDVGRHAIEGSQEHGATSRTPRDQGSRRCNASGTVAGAFAKEAHQEVAAIVNFGSGRRLCRGPSLTKPEHADHA
jgi:hypothetical protein